MEPDLPGWETQAKRGSQCMCVCMVLVLFPKKLPPAK